MTVMHPIIAGDHVTRLDLGENPTLQTLKRRVGWATAEKSGAHVATGFGRDNFEGGVRHRSLLFDDRLIIGRIQ